MLITPRSLTSAGVHEVPELEPLRRAGLELVPGPAGRVPDEQELTAALPGCAGWLAGIEAITAPVLAAADGLRVISRNGAGTDNIDLAAARRAGVAVERAAGANAQGVAELALALTLAALRHVPWSSSAVHEGGWRRWRGRELGECTVGLIGLGAVGRRAAVAFTALGATVVAHDPFAGTDVPAGVRPVALEELLRSCDVLSLHRPPPPDGTPVLDAAALAAVPAGAVLVNTARAALVDDEAVLAALTSGALSAYAVDAYDSEPPAPSALLRHPRVIATPHVGGYTGASVSRATRHAVENLLTHLVPR
ncbi:NAD(P)-dependent oxidoreductase [Kineococcus indalonis]|uniref:NAD(P)-dependent oxidoreductase n=1 Tax=Kineococcus indalonis TaxID=2696566 RepID=UPI00196AC68D|nr:NAD(P)-dependent oxidoreductase [Kineococcus indalonis]